MTPTREGLLTTIRALLEMTERRGCTKAEAAAARSKAVNLMRKYDISVEDLWPPPAVGGPPQTAAAASSVSPAWQETDPAISKGYDDWSTHGVYSDDVFVRESFSCRSVRGRKPLSPVARVIAGCAVAGLVVFIIGDISQLFTPDTGGAAAPIATQAPPAALVSSPAFARREATLATSAPSPQATVSGVDQKLSKGW